MEPMALGSPSSPAASSSTFLPSFLMGDQQPMTPPRQHTLSPSKMGGRSLAFGQSPSSPNNSFNRSSTFRNPLSPAAPGNGIFNQNGQANGQNLNASISGPPTQGLFDSLSTERNLMQGTASPRIDRNTSNVHSNRQITSPFSPMQQPGHNETPLNDSIYNHPTPRRPSIIPGPKHNFTSSPFTTTTGPSVSALGASINPNNGADCWITVFGFPQSATGMMLTHFSQCGTIVNKVHPQNSGNWMHLKFTSRLECDRALNYNEKVLNNFFMIGVTRCKDPMVLEREQREDLENSSFIGNTSLSGGANTTALRPLAHVAYKSVQSPTDVLPSPTAPTKSAGILDRAMDFFLGW